jgi:hypothetical protein
MSRQLSHECVLSDVFHTPYRSARLLDFKCWKYDKTKPYLKKDKEERKCSNEHRTQFYTEIVHKINSGCISTENTTSTTYYGQRNESTISFHYNEKNVCTKRIHFKVLGILQRYC